LTAIVLPVVGGLLAAGAGALSLWATARLAVLTGPRSLTEHQRSALVAALRPVAGDTIEIATVSGDAEAAAFAADIRDVFSAAGWQIYRGEIQGAANTIERSFLVTATHRAAPDARSDRIPRLR
jgi:hypothetical protein